MKTLFSQVRIVAALSVAGALSMIGWNESAAQRQDQPFLQPSIGGTGEPDVGWALSPAWQDWSLNLRDAGVAVKRAVDAKNQMALRSAGDALVEVCEGCHKQFKPGVPTELLHVPHGHDPF